MSANKYAYSPIWPILVETVHSMVMYPHHKYYAQSVILSEKPDISPQDMASSLGISLGEALVILYELKPDKQEKK